MRKKKASSRRDAEAQREAIVYGGSRDGLGQHLWCWEEVAKTWTGSAMLQNAFAEFTERGKISVGLDVDATSLTGANCAYERAGMRPTRQTDAYEKELRPGVDLRRQAL